MPDQKKTSPGSFEVPTENCFSTDFEQRRLAALADYQILDTEDESAFDDITELASFICDAPIAVINFIDRDRQWFKSVKGLDARETPLDVSICAHAILQSDLFIIPDTTKDRRFSSNPLVTQEPNLRFYAGALLKDRDELPLGTLCVLDHQPRELDERQLSALQALANQVMALLELKRSLREKQSLIERLEDAQEELAHSAATDHLTGLLNRRTFENRLTREFAFIERGGPEAALLLIDLDYFKEINDQFGHLAGDQALVGFANLCREVFRQTDLVARWGGEEFVVLMPRTNPKDAHAAVERLRRRLANTSLLDKEIPQTAITFSTGLCALTSQSDLEEVMDSVDRLLYQAKEEGRDRVVCTCCSEAI